MQSAYDEDATYRKKSNVGQSGYVLEIAETCDKDNPFQLITDYTVEANNVSDVEIIQDRLGSLKQILTAKTFMWMAAFIPRMFQMPPEKRCRDTPD